jgi:hypothetical protein
MRLEFFGGGAIVRQQIAGRPPVPAGSTASASASASQAAGLPGTKTNGRSESC